MGKLHTLRRAILRDPEPWLMRSRDGRVFGHYGAGEGAPGAWGSSGWAFTRLNGVPHGSFVRKVLRSLNLWVALSDDRGGWS